MALSNRRNVDGHDVRANLLNAALKAFAERGYHAATTRDIAVAAGLSPAAVYVHYKSKEELLFQIARNGHDLILDGLHHSIAAGGPPREQLCRAIKEFVRFHAEQGTTVRVITYQFPALTAAHQTEIDGIRRAINAEIRAIVERGIAAGEFTVADPGLAATAIASLAIDLSRWYRDSGTWTPEYVADFYAELALRLVGAQGRP